MAKIVTLTEFSAPELDVYARLTEGQLRSRRDREKGIFIAESPKVISHALDAGYQPLSLLMERRHIDGPARELIDRCGEVLVYTGEPELLARLGAMGFKTAAMALDDRAVSVEDPALTGEEKLAIVLGTEGDGLAPKTIAECDYTVCIPMSRGVDSLNVAAAGAVAFWQLRAR